MSSYRLAEGRQATLDVDDVAGACVGTLVGIDNDGRPLVMFPGGPVTSTPARLAVSAPRPSHEELQHGVGVVLMFEDGDARRPIVVGIVRDRFEPLAERPVALLSEDTRALTLNGSAVIVEGQDEIVLKCGLGSLTIRANGQIVIKGTRLVSRASETNKIRGAAVHIN
jgi:hypothetical protein